MGGWVGLKGLPSRHFVLRALGLRVKGYVDLQTGVDVCAKCARLGLLGCRLLSVS